MNTRVHSLLTESDSKVCGPVLDFASDSPEALMEAFLDGEVQAFERLFRQLSPRVNAALSQMSGDPRLSEDLTQVVFLKLYRARSAYQRGTSLMPWVFAIARNTFLDERRRRRRRPESLSSDGTLPEPEVEARGEPEHPLSASLRDLLRGLPSSQQEALVLLKVQGLSLAEVASLSGTSVASIKMRVHRAYRSLRETLGARGLREASAEGSALHRQRGRTAR